MVQLKFSIFLKKKNKFFKNIINFQIALKFSLFELSNKQTKKKIATRFFNKVYINKKILGARALARAAHAKPHIAVKTQKPSNLSLGGQIFYRRARGSARAPKKILSSYSSLNFAFPRYLECIQISWIGCCRRIWNSWLFVKKVFSSKNFQIFKFWKFFEKKSNLEKNH